MGETGFHRSNNLNVGIEAISYCLGSSQLSNETLELENPGWDMSRILERSGVVSRPIAGPSETALDLGEKAVLALLRSKSVPIEDIDALIFCTQTPDHVLPPNSALLHGRLGMPQEVMAFDITHACSGFIYGLGIARSLVQSGTVKRVLLVNADTYTRLLHTQDRSTRPIFGDGAAATLISATSPMMSVLDISFGTAGKQANRFMVKSGGARYPDMSGTPDAVIESSGRVRSDSHVFMDGLGVLSFFTSVVPTNVKNVLSRNQLTMGDISHFVFHQASRLALEGLQRSLAIPDEKMVVDLNEIGNLVSASIPVALVRALASKNIQTRQLIMLCGFGVGLSWGSALVRFDGVNA